MKLLHRWGIYFLRIRLYSRYQNGYGIWCVNILHIHTGFNDFSLFWAANGKLMALFFIRIN